MSPSPTNDPDLDGYEDRYVAFLDVPGFAVQVERAEREPDERTKVREVLRLMRDTLGERTSVDLRFTYFSDCHRPLGAADS